MRVGWKKTDQYYHLSETGKQHAGRLSLEDFSVRLQPKIVTVPVCFRGSEVLLFQWRREPGYGKASLVNGKLHFGEPLVEAAHRELQEKTGLSANLRHVGDVYSRELDGEGECKKHRLSHIFVGRDPEGEVASVEVGEAMWVEQTAVRELDLLPGTSDILDLIVRREGRFFFRELRLPA